MCKHCVTRFDTLIVEKQEDFSDASHDTASSTPSSPESTPAKAKPQRPICLDFIWGKCLRSVCYFRHEFPPEQQGMGAVPQRRCEADVVCVTAVVFYGILLTIPAAVTR